MKKQSLLATVVSLSFLVSVEVFGQGCDNPDATDRVRIYYINGAQNTSNNAEEIKDRLVGLVGQTPDRDFGLSFHSSQDFITDMLEVGAQLGEEPSRLWSWFNDLSIAPEWFKNVFRDGLRRNTQKFYDNDAELRTMVRAYLEDLSAGKKVVLVAYSQGNFYANSAYQYIKDNYPEFENSIGIVSVGSEAGTVRDGGYYSINSLDTVVNFVRAYNLFSVLPSTFTYDQPNSRLNHRILFSYFPGDGASIRDYVYRTVQRLDAPPRRGECEDPIGITTGESSNISASSATVSGNLTSGEEVYVWVEKQTNGDPPNCSDTASDKPSTGNYNAGNTIAYLLAGLSDNTEYRYRFCAKGGGNGVVSDGGVKSFKTYANCGESFDAQGGTDGLETTVAVGYDRLQRIVEVKFDAFGIPDKLVIKNARTGGTKYSTDGFVSGEHRGSFRQDDPQGIVKVIVTGNSDDGTQWELTVGCTGEELPDSIRSTNLEEIQNTVESTVR